MIVKLANIPLHLRDLQLLSPDERVLKKKIQTNKLTLGVKVLNDLKCLQLVFLCGLGDLPAYGPNIFIHCL